VFPLTHRSVVRTPCFGIQVHWPGKCFAPSPALLCYHALPNILLRIYFSFTVASSTSQSVVQCIYIYHCFRVLRNFGQAKVQITRISLVNLGELFNSNDLTVYGSFERSMNSAGKRWRNIRELISRWEFFDELILVHEHMARELSDMVLYQSVVLVVLSRYLVRCLRYMQSKAFHLTHHVVWRKKVSVLQTPQLGAVVVS